MFAAVLDTCVLWPSLQRDALLSLAVEGLYRPVWSGVILDELRYHEERKLIDRHGVGSDQAGARADRLITAMRTAFEDAEITGWESLEGSYGLPDVDDEHVVAAAVVADAGVIVTHNVTDFPDDRIPAGIETQGPPEFAHHMVSLNPAAGLRGIEMIAARSGRLGPPRNVPDILSALEDRYGWTGAVTLLRNESKRP